MNINNRNCFIPGKLYKIKKDIAVLKTLDIEKLDYNYIKKDSVVLIINCIKTLKQDYSTNHFRYEITFLYKEKLYYEDRAHDGSSERNNCASYKQDFFEDLE